MRVAIFLATLFTASVSAIASGTGIVSPDHPQTFAYGEVIWRQLYLERASGGLAARITFSNLPYVSDIRSQSHGFAVIRSSVGLIWRRARKSICIKRAGA
jgi:hypothetical protein